MQIFEYKMSLKDQKLPSNTKLFLLVSGWYICNTLYNVYNKKATQSIHAHWFVAAAQLFIGIIISVFLWMTSLRKTPFLSAGDIASCIPIGLFACIAHGGSVLAMGVGTVSFAQIVKACEPIFAAFVGVIIPPFDIKPVKAYVMLFPIVGGVGLACVKQGKGININIEAFMYASIANAAAALKGKVGGAVAKSLKQVYSKNMDSANVYAIVNIISFICTIPMVVTMEASTLKEEWYLAASKSGSLYVVTNIALSGFFFYVYNEFAFAFTASVGAVTSSVLNTAKRVIIIVVSAILFNENMDRNSITGSTIAILGTFAYSLVSKKKHIEITNDKEKAS